jgi:predicted metal-dependent phosphoesterase TrpH
MIDLHTHTNESDGTYTPAELVEAALTAGLEALAITDHETFAGYDRAAPIAAAKGLDLVCGIEVNTHLSRTDRGRERAWSIHLLGYFLHSPPPDSFRGWLSELLQTRRERNVKLVKKLRSMGVAIELGEVETMGRTLTGRPHFAQVLVDKGYVSNSEEAFRKYLGESSPGFVQRDSPNTVTGIQQINAGGGLAVLAHPVRLGILDRVQEERLIAELRDGGLRGIEVYHSDHRPADVERYAALAKKLDLAVSGGSDFHGAAKPHIHLGTGLNGNLNVPREVLDNLISREIIENNKTNRPGRTL